MAKPPEWTQIGERSGQPIKLHTFRLFGPVPSKKNNLAPRANGRLGVSREIQDQLDSLIIQARLQWGARKPLEHPAMEFQIHCLSGKQDRDNIVTSLLDCLKKAGVLVDDSTARCNGLIVIHPSRLAIGDPFVEIILGEFI